MNSNTYAARAGRYTGLAYRQMVWALTQIDWAEVGQIVWHGLIALVICTYLAGEMTGRWVHATNDRLARLWVGVLVREAAGTPAAPADLCSTCASVQHLQLLLPPAAAPVALLAPAKPTEPPVLSIDAVAFLAAGGMSQRAIADALGVSRSKVRRALAAA